MARMARRVESFGTTIFTEINERARVAGAINLGQGRPDFDGPAAVVAAARAAMGREGVHQYPPGNGIPELRQALAAHHGSRYGLAIDPERGALVTPGATEAVFCAIMGLVDPGDEVIVIEPYFDSYVPGLVMAGSTPVFVPLRGDDWRLDPAELRAAVTPRTRALILNTPHNPSGRVLSATELADIAAVCREHDLTVISDEVYEHLTFDDAVHIPIATLPDMAARTVTIGSAGKTFGMTGWKVGWVLGPEPLLDGVRRAHQFVSFSTNHPAQWAVAHGFSLPESHFHDNRALYARKRDLLLHGIRAAGLHAATPQGAYFVVADFSAVYDGDDAAFARHLIDRCGVACIPPSAFYSPGHRHLAHHLARFSFCKHDATLEQAATRLQRLHD